MSSSGERRIVPTSIDIDAYFERILWRGELRHDLATLAGLLDAHMSRIPFENLDVLLGREISLELGHLERKLVRARRGGYCFEHVTFFAGVLRQLGFSPVLHSARVTLFNPRSVAARTHGFLTVSLEGSSFVVDPGFGLLAPRAPVPLVERGPDLSGPDTHWMARDGHYWLMRARRGTDTVDAWAATVEADNAMDFEVENHFTATHPASPFVNRLMLRALTSDGYVSAMNRDVTVWRDGRAHATRLPDRKALRLLLQQHFGFDLPEVERLRVPAISEWR
jgi:N-hydroxyarylamine O-acetyltransferase